MIDVEGTVTVKGITYRYAAKVTPGRAGRTYGRPEDCYPGEAAEVDEVTSIEILDEDEEVVTSIANAHPALERAIEEDVQDKVASAEADAKADADDRKYDEMKDNRHERD